MSNRTPTRINACSACSSRYSPIDNPEKVKKCCYETCASFHGMNDIEHTKCGQACQKCIKIKIPKESVYGTDITNDFKNCLYANPEDLSEALQCCLEKCRDFKCQEQCIDSYNAIQEPVVMSKESFRYEFAPSHLILYSLIGFLLYDVMIN